MINMTNEEYEEMAEMSIKKYLNSSEDNATIKSLYGLAVKRIVAKAQEMDIVKVNGVIQFSTDGQSYTFNKNEAFEITADIAILLPTKKKYYAW